RITSAPIRHSWPSRSPFSKAIDDSPTNGSGGSGGGGDMGGCGILCGACLRDMNYGASAQTGSAGSAQDYPNRPARWIMPFAAGGPSDFVARLVGGRLSEVFGQPIVVDNRAGASGMIGS